MSSFLEVLNKKVSADRRKLKKAPKTDRYRHTPRTMKVVEQYQGQRPRLVMLYDRYNVTPVRLMAVQSVGRILKEFSQKSLPREAEVTMAFPSGMNVLITIESF